MVSPYFSKPCLLRYWYPRKDPMGVLATDTIYTGGSEDMAKVPCVVAYGKNMEARETRRKREKTWGKCQAEWLFTMGEVGKSSSSKGCWCTRQARAVSERGKYVGE